MKKLLSSLILILLCITPSSAETTLKIGISTALTGMAANYGLDLKDTIQFANDSFGEGRYQLIFEDDKCDSKTAVSVAKKFIHIDKVDFVMGYACSGAALAAAPLYEKAKIPVLITCSSSAKISNAGDYIFRTTPSDRGAATKLFGHIENKYKTFGTLAEETDYAQDMKAAFSEASQNTQIKLINEDYLPGTTAFKPLLLRLRVQKIEGLFIIAQSEGTFANIAKQIKELAWNVPMYGAYWPGSPAFLKIAGTAAEGIEFVDTPSLDFMLTPEGKAIASDYHKNYKIRSVGSILASSYEALNALDAAVKSGKDIRSYLYQTKFNGIFGPYSFNSSGDIEGMPFMLKKIVNGKAVAIED